MQSPLSVDKETVKKYKITDDIDVSPVQKIGFLQDQLQELQAILWRSRVDVIHAKRLQESTNQVLKNKGLSNESEHTNQVEQFTGAIRMVKKLIDELRQEYPELAVEE